MSPIMTDSQSAQEKFLSLCPGYPQAAWLHALTYSSALFITQHQNTVPVEYHATLAKPATYIGIPGHEIPRL